MKIDETFNILLKKFLHVENYIRKKWKNLFVFINQYRLYVNFVKKIETLFSSINFSASIMKFKFSLLCNNE